MKNLILGIVFAVFTIGALSSFTTEEVVDEDVGYEIYDALTANCSPQYQ